MTTSINDVSDDVMITKIMSHLYPTDLIKLRKVSVKFRTLLKKEFKIVDKTCKHIQPHGKITTPVMERLDMQETNITSQSCSYVEGRLHGECVKYFSNGRKALLMHYVNGINTGKTLLWHDNGNLSTEINMMTGEKHGLSVVFYKK
jgi:antitoxin component YwqK of YwqJK toxin-antitoxin module